MGIRIAPVGITAAIGLTVTMGLAGCEQMGDIKDIAACQAFAAAQTGYDKAVNSAQAAPSDQAKQAQWLGAWVMFMPGIKAAAELPTTESLKSEMAAYAKAVSDAGPGASAATQLELWSKGYATKLVKLCNELAAPIEITDITAK